MHGAAHDFARRRDEHLRIMVDEGVIRAAIADDADAFAELRWGSRLACVVVDLRRAADDQVRELLTDAWRRNARRALVRACECEA